eukprot:XP_011448024.1 PREDICTED: uncharacterized protein LOC105342697 isoform X2 [Crassostrea gigas]
MNMFVPVEIGETCLLNETEWMKRKALSNCTDTSGSPPKEYHCITNNLEVPGEVCMGSGWVQPNYCPIFNLNAKDFDAVPCDPQRGICSSQQFQSRDVFKYPGCLNFTRQPPDVVHNGGMKPGPNFLPMIAGAGVAVATLVVISICCVWYCRRRSGGSGKKQKNDVEMSQPLVETFPSEFHRTCHYLKANVFYPTKVFTKCIGLFEVHGILTFVGPHGSGKTTNAVNLLSKKVGTQINGKNCVVEVCESVEEVESKVVEGCVTFVLLDDVLDQYAYQPALLKAHKEKFTDLKKIIDEGKLRLICTVTDTTWRNCAKEIGDCPMFQKDLVVELTEKVLDKDEKMEILKKHLAYNKFNVTQKKKEENLKKVDKRNASNSSITIYEKTLQNWAKKAKGKAGIGSPLLFDLMCVNKHLFASADNLLSDSFENILKMRIDFQAKQSTGQNSKDFVCLLLFAAFFGGKISLRDFRKKECSKIKEDAYVNICSKKGCSAKGENDIGELLRSDELSGFFYPLKDCYVFHHKILTPLLLSMTAQEDEILVLKHAELDVLFKVLQPQKSKYPFAVTVSEKALLSDLIPRIWEAPNVIAKWKRHVVMQSEKLKKQLENPPSLDEEKKK